MFSAKIAIWREVITSCFLNHNGNKDREAEGSCFQKILMSICCNSYGTVGTKALPDLVTFTFIRIFEEGSSSKQSSTTTIALSFVVIVIHPSTHPPTHSLTHHDIQDCQQGSYGRCSRPASSRASRLSGRSSSISSSRSFRSESHQGLEGRSEGT
jgi:hypothetical protein